MTPLASDAFAPPLLAPTPGLLVVALIKLQLNLRLGPLGPSLIALLTQARLPGTSHQYSGLCVVQTR